MVTKNKTQVVCVAEHRALEGKEEALIEALHSLIETTLKEPGCLRYELNQREDDPRWITFIEKWKDQKSFDDHCASAGVANYFNNVRPVLVERLDVKLYREFLL